MIRFLAQLYKKYSSKRHSYKMYCKHFENGFDDARR